jgi:hypothetical protein
LRTSTFYPQGVPEQNHVSRLGVSDPRPQENEDSDQVFVDVIQRYLIEEKTDGPSQGQSEGRGPEDNQSDDMVTGPSPLGSEDSVIVNAFFTLVN